MGSLSFKHPFRENAIVLAFFFVAVHLLYWKTWQAGFVTDFTGLQERLEGAPFSDILNCFGFPALHQVTNFFLYSFYKIFGVNPLPWYLVFTGLHVVNGWLGYRLAKKMYRRTPVRRHARPPNWSSAVYIPAFIASLLFLLSPYNAETVIWKVCFNFLFCTCMMLSSLLFLIKYIEKEKRADLIIAHALFVVALFTFELALALPLMALAFLFFLNNGKSIRKKIWPISGVQFFFTGIYFLLNKIWLGSWVGHYGEEVHLNFSLNSIASNCIKYFTKNLFYWREWGHGTKEAFIQFLDKPVIGYAFLIAGILLFITYIVFLKKINQKIKTIVFAWLLFFIALAPISNLFVAWILHGENDRYGYFASLFFYIGLIALFQNLNKKIRPVFYCLFLLASIIYLNKINGYWKNSAEIVNSLLTDFKWKNNSEIYVLAFPENYKGIPMFKDFSREDLALKHALKYNAKKETKGKFYQIAQFNMNARSDGFIAKTDSNNIIKLEFREWGSWWWRHGIGTGSYETDKYDFKTVNKGCEISIKNVTADAVFIYSDGGQWQEVFLNKGND